MAGPSNEFQEDVESDRDIQPLAVNASRLPFVFFVVAVVAALLVLFLLQLFSSNNTATEQIREEFRPPTANIVNLSLSQNQKQSQVWCKDLILSKWNDFAKSLY